MKQPCPVWCAAGHRCTAHYGYAGGEHRSAPISVRTPYGVMVCTRVQRTGDCSRLEIRLQVDLSGPESRAQAEAEHVAGGVDLAVRRVLAALGTTSRRP